ncbi:type II toxin-antitoxin system VapC family toxin [Brachybacterium sp. HMSC06H03]|uniref:type II toxin-antitoxin system VapC family toxin n=1 Tax=Brachybacterium sp. HMSC06H03 TaxID=1581127 RepID=UPI001FEF12B6|nr:type II toxin-antitoxin system VapC family toxin [Brachybacterium sp. HMSC06H03]
MIVVDAQVVVVDASAMVEALVGDAPPPELISVLGEATLAAPHLLDVEIVSVLRGLERGRRIMPEDAHAALRTYFSMSITRYGTALLAERIWDLRHRCTAYDAGYLALAELLGAPLVTADEKLTAAGSEADIVLLDSLAP